MKNKDRGTLKATGLFRVLEKRFATEVELYRGTEQECAEIFGWRPDRADVPRNGPERDD